MGTVGKCKMGHTAGGVNMGFIVQFKLLTHHEHFVPAKIQVLVLLLLSVYLLSWGNAHHLHAVRVGVWDCCILISVVLLCTTAVN